MSVVRVDDFPDLPDPLPAALSCGFYRVTPERAGRLLEANQTRNRYLIPTKLTRNRRDLSAGKWQLNGESMAFTPAGDVHDGHHRLTACRDAGVPFVSLCAFGIDPGTFLTVDTGASRGAQARLQIAGEANAKRLGAILRLVWNWSNGDPPTSHGTTAEYAGEEEQLTLETFPDVRQATSECSACYVEFPQITDTAWGFVLFVTRRTCPTRAESFVQKLRTEVGLTEDDPVAVLRTRLIRLGKAKLPQKEMMVLIAKAWVAHALGRPMKQLRYDPETDDFPSFDPADHGPRPARKAG